MIPIVSRLERGPGPHQVLWLLCRDEYHARFALYLMPSARFTLVA